jgi:tetratricopeptide (TPR) repeat protein
MPVPSGKHHYTLRPTHVSLKVFHSFLKQLKEDIAFRRIEDGIQLLNGHRDFIESCSPKRKNSATLIGHLAQWVDIGFGKVSLVKELLKRFPVEGRAKLPVREFVHLEMAEGFVAMHEQGDEEAIRHFEVVLAVQNEISDQDLITIANFWIARCYRRLSRYQDALQYVTRARESAMRSKHYRTVGVIQVLEGWLLFQEGRVNEAAEILNAAETLLIETDDFVARGNLNSTYSRIARRNGDYHEALRRSEIAIQEFKKRDWNHRNLARSLANNAFVKRMLALEIAEKLDREAARTRKISPRGPSSAGDHLQRDRERVKALREQACRDLIEAGAISSRFRDYRAEGDVQITYAYLHLDNGEIDLASSRAAAAYQLGEDKKDVVLKARARVLQSAIESDKVDEQIFETAGSRRPIRMSCEYAREAVELAKYTQNRQLIAQAWVTLGLAQVNEGNIEGASHCSDQAAGLLTPDNHDISWRDLLVLKSRLNTAGNIEVTLREWSRGDVGNKTFQQITEDFAAIVIPKVWKNEGCKISRVATRLSISPKKVRRILRSQGISTGTE